MAQVEQEFAKAFRNVNITLQSLDEVKALYTILNNSSRMWKHGVDDANIRLIEDFSYNLWEQLGRLDDVCDFPVETI